MVDTDDGDAVGMTGLEAINSVHGSAIQPVFVAEQWRDSGIGIRMVCNAVCMKQRTRPPELLVQSNYRNFYFLDRHLLATGNQLNLCAAPAPRTLAPI